MNLFSTDPELDLLWLTRLIRPWGIINQKVAADSIPISVRKMKFFKTSDLSPLLGTNIVTPHIENQTTCIKLNYDITTKQAL